MPEAAALVQELRDDEKTARDPLWQKVFAAVPGLLEQLLLRIVRLALVEEASLGAVVGSEGRPIPPSRGDTIGRRALRRILDEAQEARTEAPWQRWDMHEVDALEHLAQHLGSRVQALCMEYLGPLRPPLAGRRRAADEAAAIAVAVERGQLWS